MNPRLLLALVIAFDPSTRHAFIVKLPGVRTELINKPLNPFAVGFIREVCAHRTAAVVGSALDDPFAALTVDAHPARS